MRSTAARQQPRAARSKIERTRYAWRMRRAPPNGSGDAGQETRAIAPLTRRHRMTPAHLEKSRLPEPPPVPALLPVSIFRIHGATSPLTEACRAVNLGRV